MLIGFHVSIAGSIDQAIDRASSLGCTTFQIFTRNPRGWAFSNLKSENIKAFKDKAIKAGYSCIIVHMPYLPNLSSPNKEVYTKSLGILKAEYQRCGWLSIQYLVAHLGSHMGSGESAGIDRLAKACNTVLGEVDNKVILLLENTAGTKNSIGSSFENLRAIIDQVTEKDRIGICFDTCHAFAAGYDLRNESAQKMMLSRFQRIIGLDRMKVVHVNDSKGPLGCGSDRHEHIGLGSIGEEGFRVLLRDRRLKGLPFIMETPVDARRDDRGNMEMVRSLVGPQHN